MQVTLIDSLDTMMLMGLTEPLRQARAWIADNLHFDKVSAHIGVMGAMRRG